jgi:hypothetical protein
MMEASASALQTLPVTDLPIRSGKEICNCLWANRHRGRSGGGVMNLGLYGTAGVLVLFAGVGVMSVADAGSYKPAIATVSTIDRVCDFVETKTYGDGRKEAHGLTDSCNSTDEWNKIRDQIRNKQRTKISGKETVHIAYTAPKGGSFQTADLHFTGNDDEFYELVAGSQLKILVNDEDPSKIKRT